MNNKRCFACVILGLAASSLPVAAAEERRAPIELGAPFADNMILQRDMDVPVWGWSKPGTGITVEFAGQKRTAQAGEDGKWKVTLTPMKASFEPRIMAITSSIENRKFSIGNILVGEVWMCSGQSNMQWPANKCDVGRVLMAQVAERVKAGVATQPVIREGKVTSIFSSLYPIEHANGEWSDGSNFDDYSAIALAFAYELYRELGVPIGILNGAFSTTSIQAWIPREGIESGTDEYTRGLYRRVLEGDYRTSEHKTAWEMYYRNLRDWARDGAKRCRKGLTAEAPPDSPGNLHGNRDISWMYNGKISPMVPYAIRGAIWNQGYASSGEGMAYYNNLHSLVRGWRKVLHKPDLPVYFHQFYSGGADDGLSLNCTAEMRLGTWLARDIPNANMASQIDIGGSVHYFNKTLPGRRLALHALKNQYAREIVTDGPMFESYKVDGKRLIVEFEHAEGGLVVAETLTNSRGTADPTVIENGNDRVTLFYLADADRVWHRATMTIDGEGVVLTAPEVTTPRGVAYGCNGIGTLPNLYNRALLPLTPFIYYDHKLVTSDTWPEERLRLVDDVPAWQTRRFDFLASQYRDNCVIQAGVPTPFWGQAPTGSVIKVSFAGTEKTCTIGPGERGWQMEFPPLPASSESRTLKVTCEVEGELWGVNEITNVVVGDVWYVAAPDFRFTVPMATDRGDVRLFTPNAAKRSNRLPYRYKLEIPPKGTRHYAVWRPAGMHSERSPIHVFANVLGARIQAKTGKPVGIVVMDTRDKDNIRVANWIGYDWLKKTPSLMKYYEDMRPRYHPDPQDFIDRVERGISDWQTFWQTVPPQVMASKRFDEGVASIEIPRLPAAQDGKTSATETYNMLITAFNPGNFKGVVCLTPASFFEEDEGANFGPELSVMADCWQDAFGCGNPYFFYTIPAKALAPKVTRPERIKSKGFEITRWLTDKEGNEQLLGLIELVVDDVYR